MKFTITMKDPDGPGDAITFAANRYAIAMGELDKDEQEAVAELKREQLAKIASKWLKYGEYVSIEIDTEALTATVLPK